jgi:hypothetical protein
MAASDIIGVLGGIAGNKKAARANQLAEDANAISVDASRTAREANRISELANTLSGESNRIAVEANAISRSGLSQQQQAEYDARTAKLVHRYPGPGSVIPWSRTGETGKLKIRLFNEGPAVARDVQLSVTFRDGRTNHSAVINAIPLEKEVVPEVPFHRFDLGEDIDAVFGYRIVWRDGNGPQEMKLGIRIQGPYLSDWRAFIEPYPYETSEGASSQ